MNTNVYMYIFMVVFGLGCFSVVLLAPISDTYTYYTNTLARKRTRTHTYTHSCLNFNIE